jgi:hypothetical protein
VKLFLVLISAAAVLYFATNTNVTWSFGGAAALPPSGR